MRVNLQSRLCSFLPTNASLHHVHRRRDAAPRSTASQAHRPSADPAFETPSTCRAVETVAGDSDLCLLARDWCVSLGAVGSYGTNTLAEMSWRTGMTFYAVLLYDFGPREHVFMPVSSALIASIVQPSHQSSSCESESDYPDATAADSSDAGSTTTPLLSSRSRTRTGRLSRLKRNELHPLRLRRSNPIRGLRSSTSRRIRGRREARQKLRRRKESDEPPPRMDTKSE